MHESVFPNDPATLENVVLFKNWLKFERGSQSVTDHCRRYSFHFFIYLPDLHKILRQRQVYRSEQLSESSLSSRSPIISNSYWAKKLERFTTMYHSTIKRSSFVIKPSLKANWDLERWWRLRSSEGRPCPRWIPSKGRSEERPLGRWWYVRDLRSD